jgi:hypothetical protein
MGARLTEELERLRIERDALEVEIKRGGPRSGEAQTRLVIVRRELRRLENGRRVRT